MKIGFFDSGLGGLTILKAVASQLPEYDYEFYGDTANLPYGGRTEEEIYQLTEKGIKHLFDRECRLVIVACNTSSAESLRKLQDGFLKEFHSDRRVLGVIIPTIEAVIEAGIQKVLLIGTKRTVESKKYEAEFAKHPTAPVIYSVATPELVPLIEEGELEDAIKVAAEAVERESGVDGVILGCTHYALLREGLIKQFEKSKIQFFSQELIIPSKLKNYLERHKEIESRLSRGGTRNIFLTGNDSKYDTIIQELLGGTFVGD
jgi:glutamate racemase